MIAELSHFALILALLAAFVQAGAGYLGVERQQPALILTMRNSAIAQAALTGLAFIGLTVLFLQSDFSVITVLQNSHSAKPLLYKVAGVWGNHEGSLLLWVLVLAVFGAVLAMTASDLAADKVKSAAVAVHGLLGIGFLMLLLFTSNPFGRVLTPPPDGQDLNPLLQDPALALHPPLLYVGYVGFATAFAFAIAGLWTRKVDREWAKAMTPWVLVAWAFLTLGIALGSWWAYYELGWGGWWFWDPVENASLMPWLAGTALLHSVQVVAKRESVRAWTVLLALLAFSLSLLGTFLVRSGVITSVHAFALDPERGMFILALIGIVTGGSLLLYALRAPQLSQGSSFAMVSREGGLILNNVLLAISCAVVLLGTLYPLILEAAGLPGVSVGPPYYNAVVIPIIAPLLIAVSIAPLLPWRRAMAKHVPSWLLALASLSVAGAVLVAGLTGTLGAMAAVGGLAAGFWILLGAGAYLWRRSAAADWRTRIARLRGLDSHGWGLTLGHLGLGLFVLGVAASALLSTERITAMRIGETMTHAGYELTFDTVRRVDGPNYLAEQAVFSVRAPQSDKVVYVLRPEKRWYPIAAMRTTEASIVPDGWANLYASLGQSSEDGQRWSVHFQHHPLIALIWYGSGVMALGGLIAGLGRTAARFLSAHQKVGGRASPTHSKLGLDGKEAAG